MKPLVSIITVVRNGEKVIERTVKSIINQTYPHIEYIVIDGASQDNTLKIVNKYKSKISRIISEPDKSHFDAMNKGLEIAKGEYVWFVHAGDQVYDKDTVKKVFQKEFGADVYYGNTALTDSDGTEIGMWWRRAPENLTWKHMKSGMIISHQSFIIRRKLAGKYSLEYSISSDVDWVIKGLKKSIKIVNTRLILSKYSTGGLSSRKAFNAAKERFEILTHHFGLMSTILHNSFLVPKFLFHKIMGKPIH